jgi:hypothetical protein
VLGSQLIGSKKHNRKAIATDIPEMPNLLQWHILYHFDTFFSISSACSASKFPMGTPFFHVFPSRPGHLRGWGGHLGALRQLLRTQAWDPGSNEK